MINLNYEPILRGIGSSLSYLSLVNSLDQDITIWNHKSNSTFEEMYQNLFSNSKLKFKDTFEKCEEEFKWSEMAKFFSPYPLQAGARSPYKRTIGISFYKSNMGYTEKFLDNNPEWPYNRHYPLALVDEIIAHLQVMGFKLVYLDNRQPNEKISDRINSMRDCFCIISYEGGNANLAHCLGIPTILFGWRGKPHDADWVTKHNDGIPDAEDYYNIEAWPQMLHLDSKTEFIDHPQRILEMTKSDLLAMADRLENSKGNNWYMNQQSVKFETVQRVSRRGFPVKGLNDTLVFKHLFNGKLAHLLMTEQEFKWRLKNPDPLLVGGKTPTNAKELYQQSFNQ